MVKLMICGHARHGKDTVADLIAREMGLKFESTTMWCAKNIIMKSEWAHAKCYRDHNQAFIDRTAHREHWKSIIAQYNTPDVTKLGRTIFSDFDIYVGCRSGLEFAALRSINAFDCAIWVDASKHHKNEPTNDVVAGDCDIIIDNNGTTVQLAQRVYNLCRILKK